MAVAVGLGVPVPVVVDGPLAAVAVRARDAAVGSGIGPVVRGRRAGAIEGVGLGAVGLPDLEVDVGAGGVPRRAHLSQVLAAVHGLTRAHRNGPDPHVGVDRGPSACMLQLHVVAVPATPAAVPRHALVEFAVVGGDHGTVGRGHDVHAGVHARESAHPPVRSLVARVAVAAAVPVGDTPVIVVGGRVERAAVRVAAGRAVVLGVRRQSGQEQHRDQGQPACHGSATSWGPSGASQTRRSPSKRGGPLWGGGTKPAGG